MGQRYQYATEKRMVYGGKAITSLERNFDVDNLLLYEGVWMEACFGLCLRSGFLDAKEPDFCLMYNM